MHGLIFVTWEKYLVERFKGSVLAQYREAIGETPATSPLASHVYDDARLLAGVAAASRITGTPPERLLREYGRYFILNGLTGHLCTYLLSRVHSGRDLLLAMHDAHEQMSRMPDGLTPPLFQYAVLPGAPYGLVLIYDSPRKLCDVLMGAIEGAAERYEEHVYINERACMKRGDDVCRFEIRFSAPSHTSTNISERQERQQAQQKFADFIFTILPASGGLTLAELQTLIRQRSTNTELARPARLLEALNHLHHAGLVATTANQPGDDFTHRRYWRAPTSI